MECGKCGSKNEIGDDVCRQCGELLVSDAEQTISLSRADLEQAQAELELAVEDEPVLVVKKGAYVGQKFSLTKDEITLGRDPASDIFLDDITISRHHAKIKMKRNRVSVADSGSLNGTYVNQERIEEPTTLHSNDELQIGKFRMIFVSKKH
ncbi:MAG: FHA domain-containing protein [Candidatus Aquicultor sp.]|nr:FHA domain-containing protein [Candidatus Aquicultor sp.]